MINRQRRSLSNSPTTALLAFIFLLSFLLYVNRRMNSLESTLTNVQSEVEYGKVSNDDMQVALKEMQAAIGSFKTASENVKNVMNQHRAELNNNVERFAVRGSGNSNGKVVPMTMSRARAQEILQSVSQSDLNHYRVFYKNLGIPPIQEHFSPGDVVLDIGANLGKFSQSVRSSCKDCTIVAFEAVPNYAAYIVSNLQPDERTFVVPRGLSNKDEKANFFMDVNNLGWNTLVGEKSTGGMKRVEVDLVRLDNLDLSFAIPDKSKVKLIKIDTEGAECFVLAGAHEFLASLSPKPVLYIEIAWGSQNNPNWAKVVTELEWLFANGWQRINYDVIHGTTDVIIRPVEQF